MKSQSKLNTLEKRLKNYVAPNTREIPIMVSKVGGKYYAGVYGNQDLQGDELTPEEVANITGKNPDYHGGIPIIFDRT